METLPQDTDTTTYVEMKGEIVFNGVDFGYTDDKIVLHDVKLYANPGEKLAFGWLNRCRKKLLLQTLLTVSMTFRMEKSDMMVLILIRLKRLTLDVLLV